LPNTRTAGVLSCHEPSLHILRNYAGRDCRTGVWVKPFCSYKPNVNPAYAFEPVIFRGGREFTRDDPTVRNWVAANITLKRGLTGAKPRDFCRWVINLMNAERAMRSMIYSQAPERSVRLGEITAGGKCRSSN
jgi:hypothetical protein